MAVRDTAQSLSIDIPTRLRLDEDAFNANALLDFARELLAAPSQQAVLDVILNKACALLEADHGVIDMLTTDGAALIDRCARGFFATTGPVSIRQGEGIAGHIWHTGKALLIEDYARWPGRLNRCDHDAVHAIIGAPLKSDATVIGVLIIAHTVPNRSFSARQFDMLTVLASLAERAVDTVRRREQERDQARAQIQTQQISLEEVRGAVSERNRRIAQQTALLAALHEITVELLDERDLDTLLSGIMRHTKALIGAAHVFVARVLPDGSAMQDIAGSTVDNNWLVVSKRGEGIKGKVWESRRTMVLDDYSTWPGRMPNTELNPLHATAAAPLIANGNVIGVLGISETDPRKRYSPEDIETLNRLTEFASFVITRTQLITSEKRNRVIAENLLDVLRVVDSTRPLTDVLSVILERSVSLLGARSGLILRFSQDRNTLRIAAAHGLRLGHAPETHIRVDPAMLAQATRRAARGLAIPSAIARVIWQHARQNSDWRTLLGDPITELTCSHCALLAGDDGMLGGMILFGEDDAEPSADDQRVLQVLASHASAAIQNHLIRVRTIELAAQEERTRLARELHDSVSQAIFSVSLAVNTALAGARMAEETFKSPVPKVVEPLQYALNLSEAAILEMRALIFQLKPEQIEKNGLLGMLNIQIAALRSRHQLVVSLRGDSTEPPFRIDIKEAVYRVISEALHNIVKHARATEVVIETRDATNSYMITIRDNGIGFDPRIVSPLSFGLRTMRERVESLNGAFEIKSTPGSGTLISIQVPLSELA
jgi:signal transduction histidine kinase